MDANKNETRLNEYACKAKELWGETAAYKEFEAKSSKRTKEVEQILAERLMVIFSRLGRIKGQGPASKEANSLIAELQNFISENYYTCTNQILESLGQMYAAGGDFTANIDKHAGEGTAVFTNKCIEEYIKVKARLDWLGCAPLIDESAITII